MKFFALTLSLLLVTDANAVKLTQKSANKQQPVGNPEEEEAKLDATQKELNEMAAKVQDGELDPNQAE